LKIICRGIAALGIAVVELAFLPILLQAVALSLGVVDLMFLSFGLAAPVALLTSYFHDRLTSFESLIKDRKKLAIMSFSGLLNYALVQLFLTVGTIETNANVGALVYRSWVVIMILLMPLILKNKVTLIQLLAVLIGFVGVYFVASTGTLFVFDISRLYYVAILVTSAFSAAISMLIIKAYNVDYFAFIPIFNLVSFGFSAILLLVTRSPIPSNFPTAVLLALLFLATVTYTFGNIASFYSIKVLNPVLYGSGILLIPFLTIGFSFVLLGTPLRTYYFYAGALVVGAAAVQQYVSRMAPEYMFSTRNKLGYKVFDVTGAFVTNSDRAIANYVSGNKRALAIRCARNRFALDQYNSLFLRNDCVGFTNEQPFLGVKRSEIQFVCNSIGLGGGEIALICMGEPSNIRRVLSEIISQ
jgi:drug/metabolite transporter (DMT)-like permease